VIFLGLFSRSMTPILLVEEGDRPTQSAVNRFNEGEVRKHELERQLLPMLERYNVVLVGASDGLGP
jgi:hypothetical protein